MIGNQDEDEFIAVRVQDPRIQNEGSWNSYVDYKIFLHTNSRAFTAKTSCVRRRYSEFAWLKKKLQKNAGLVPVPDLPRKSIFSFSNEDFLEGRRKGLQAFLDKVVHMTVCLSDSQLHLFLQTQLPIGHIQDCVQGHTPYTVTDAILTYASSNQGFAQAQAEEAIKEPSLTISYESLESPTSHQPCLQTKETLRPELSCFGDSDPAEGLVQPCDSGAAELQQKEKSSLKVLQKNNRLEAVVDYRGMTEVNFFLGDGQEESEGLSPTEQAQQRSCQIQTPVEVHAPMGTGSEVNGGVDNTLEGRCSPREESDTTSDTGENAGARPDAEEKADRQEGSEEAHIGHKSEEMAFLDFKNTESQEDVSDDVCSELQALENQVIPDVNGPEGIGGTEVEGQDADVCSTEEILNSVRQNEPDDEKRAESESKAEKTSESEILEDAADMQSVPQVETRDDDTAQPTDQQEFAQEPDLAASEDESDEDSHSLLSSNESIVKVSDEESVCDEATDLIQAENGYMEPCGQEVPLWSDVEASSRNILDLHLNGSPAEKDDFSVLQGGEDPHYTTEIHDFGKSPDMSSDVAGGDLTENGDFSVLATSCSPGIADGECFD